MSKPITTASNSLADLLNTTFIGSGIDLQTFIGSGIDLQTLLADIYKPLSSEEKIELDQLIEQHRLDVKTAKIDLFKKTPAHIRQQVIDYATWQETVVNINQATIEKSTRQLELEQKHSRTQLGAAVHTSDGTGFTWNLPYGFTLPEGLTIDDLRQAHLEASMEEEVLGNGS